MFAKCSMITSNPTEMLHHFLVVILVVVVEDMMSSTVGHNIHSLFSTRCSNHNCPNCSGNLHSSIANSSTSSMNKNFLSGFRLCSDNQCFISCEEWHTKCCSLSK